MYFSPAIKNPGGATVPTLPVTGASCERTRSKINIINNYLQTAMLPERLEDLVEIGTGSDIADHSELEKLVEICKLANHRKIPLQNRLFSN